MALGGLVTGLGRTPIHMLQVWFLGADGKWWWEVSACPPPRQEPAHTSEVLLSPFSARDEPQSQNQSDTKKLRGNNKLRGRAPSTMTEQTAKDWCGPFSDAIPTCLPCVQFCLDLSQELQAARESQRFPLPSFLDKKENVEGFSLVSSFILTHTHIPPGRGDVRPCRVVGAVLGDGICWWRRKIWFLCEGAHKGKVDVKQLFNSYLIT